MKKIKPAKSDLFSVGNANKKLLSYAFYGVIFIIVIVISKSTFDSRFNSEQDISIKDTSYNQASNSNSYNQASNSNIAVSEEDTERLRLAVELKRKAEGLPKSNAKSQFFAILNTSIDDGVITERELDILSHALANAENYR